MSEFACDDAAPPQPRLRLVTGAPPATRAYPDHPASSARVLCAINAFFAAIDAVVERRHPADDEIDATRHDDPNTEPPALRLI